MNEKKLNAIIANNIRSYLEDTRRTQQDLAEYMGVSQATVSNWCTGTKIPRMDKFDRICGFFGVTRNDMMTVGSPEEKRTKKFEEIVSQLPDELGTVMHKYQHLDQKGRELVGVLLDHEYERCKGDRHE